MDLTSLSPLLFSTDGSFFSYSIVAVDCVPFFNCSTTQTEMGNCTIQLGQDPSYQDLGPPTSGPPNSSFPLLLMEGSTYYIQITFTLNSETFIMKGNFTFPSSKQPTYASYITDDCFPTLVYTNLSSVNYVLLVVGLILLGVDIPLFTILMAVEIKRRKGRVQHYNTTSMYCTILLYACRPVCTGSIGGWWCPDVDFSSAVGGHWRTTSK